MLRLHTFGGCFLERDGARLDTLSGHRKALALFAVLATGARGVSRESVLASLWPEADEERARTSLRQLVHALRTQLSAQDLLLPSAELRLNPDVITSDVAEFRAAVRAGHDEAAVRLHVGPFLDGFYLKGADGFERWATVERAALARDATRALEALAERATVRGDAREAADWWRRVADAEPLSARAATGLMRALDAAGERAAALQHAQVYALLVREEVGGAVDPSVMKVVDALRRDPPRSGSAASTTAAGRGPAPLRAPPAPGPAEAAAVVRSIAVLPFANTSGDPADEPISDGLTDELVAALGKMPGFKVTGRTSAFALKGRGLSVAAIADTLGVAAVLEGSWRRAGNRVRVSAQLVGADDCAVLWAETYDSELTSVLAVQEQIAGSIVSTLQARLLGHVTSPSSTRLATADTAAYELYLKGRYVFNTHGGGEGIRQAAGYFEQAIARDPSYAAAYAGLSDAYTRLAVFGYGPSRETFARAKAAACRALALDDTLAEAHVSLAHVVLASEFQWAEAERGFRRAVALDPGYTFARAPFAICLACQGRYGEAIEQLEIGRATDPLAPSIGNVLGRVLVCAGRPDDAIRTLRQVLDLNPHLDLAFQQLGHAYLQKGMTTEAIAAFRRAAALSGPRDLAQLAYALAVTGQREEAEQILCGLLDPIAPSTPGGSAAALAYHIAMAYTGLGDLDAAFRWLHYGLAERTSFMTGVKSEPGFARLHDDPRWAPLLGRMGLAA
jgi:serine/threonine-protein kinase